MSSIYNTQPAVVDLYIKRRDTVELDFDISLNDEDYDLTDAQEILFTIQSFTGEEKKVMKLSAEESGITIETNRLQISIPDGLDFYGTYKYDIEVKDGDDKIFTIMEGKVIISNDVSHAVQGETE